jgi:putative ABC transport system permease protein
MFKTALRELRHHPARYVATLVAIIISVGFMAAASVVTATEQRAVGLQQTLAYGTADVVVNVTEPEDGRGSAWESGVTSDDVTAAMMRVPGVAVAEPVNATMEVIRQRDEDTNGVGFGSDSVNIYSVPSSQLRSDSLVSGEWPTNVGELAVSEKWAKSLGLKVGDSVETLFSGQTLRVVGITNEPSTLSGSTGYVTQDTLTLMGAPADIPLREWRIKLAADAPDTADVIAGLESAVSGLSLKGTALPRSEVADNAVKDMVGGLDAFKYVLWAFAGIAMVVGMITIANTFTILLTQRRRQIGLMRAIGASGAQVRRSVFGEAFLLGLIGSVFGVLLAVLLAVAVGLYTGSLYFGIAMPWTDIALAVGIGVVVTVVAAVIPTLRATRVAPIEALLPVEASAQVRKASWVRGIICSLLSAGGLVLAWSALHGNENPLVMAILGSALITFGVLFGAPLFVPAILKVIGLITRPFGPTVRLAATNSVRNPARASATATALMLAVGLIFTIQVGSASMRETALAKIDAEMPVDFMVSTLADTGSGESELQSIPESAQTRVAAIDGVAGVAALDCTQVPRGDAAPGDDWKMPVCAYSPKLGEVVRAASSTMPDDELWIEASDATPAETITLIGKDGPVTLRVVESAIPYGGVSLVSPATAARLGTLTPACALYLSIPDRDQAVDVANALSEILTAAMGDTHLTITGAALVASIIESVLDILMLVLTGLLGVAVLVALVGVSNTLTLSVIERTRESAMLRALGLQKSSLRWMMLVEAVMVVLVGAIVGLAAGMGFGYLGSNAVVAEMTASGLIIDSKFAVDWPLTLGLLGILAAAAALASVLPGRRAANATVVEALAVE